MICSLFYLERISLDEIGMLMDLPEPRVAELFYLAHTAVNDRDGETADPEQFARVFTAKLLTYALGRGLEAYDMPTVRRIVREAEDEDYRFSALVKGIANSIPFRMRRAQDPNAVPAETVARAE